MNEGERSIKILNFEKFCVYFLLWWFLWGAATQLVAGVLSEIIFGITKSINITVVRIVGIILACLVTLKLTCDAFELTVNSLVKRKIFTYSNNIKKILILSISILAIMNISSFLPTIIKTEINISDIKSKSTIDEVSFGDSISISYYQKQEGLSFEEAKEKLINTARISYLTSTLMSIAMLIGDFFIVFVFEKKFLTKVCLDEQSLVNNSENDFDTL